MEGGVGEWYYPNGSVISADSARRGLYVTREQMSVSLNHRSGSKQTVTSGLYCCAVPTSERELIYSCIILGVLNLTRPFKMLCPRTLESIEYTQ